MSKLVINGGNRVGGRIRVDGSKNSVLPILAATILNKGESIIRDCPKLKDVEIMLEILKTLGCKVKREENVVIIDSSTLNSTEIPQELAAEMRSSIILMGSILSRYKNVTISYPGGCDILLAHKFLAQLSNIMLRKFILHIDNF